MCTEEAGFPSAESQISRDSVSELANKDLTYKNFSSNVIYRKEIEIIRPI